MLYVQSYFDESGTAGKDRLISFCGFIGTNENWQASYDRCNAVFAQLGIKNFKAAQAFRYNSPLSDILPALGVPRRVEALSELIKAIRDSLPVAIASVLDCSAFRSLPEKDRAFFHDDPTNLTFVQALVAMQRSLSARFPDPDCRVSIVCDENHKYAQQYLSAFHKVRQIHPEFRKTFVSIGFADDSYFVQLQMADFLASVARHEADRLFHGAQFDLRDLFLRFSDPAPYNMFLPAFIGKEALVELVATRKQESVSKRKSKMQPKKR